MFAELLSNVTLAPFWVIVPEVEINRETNQIISQLDEFHSKAKSHVIGITGPPGAGKSSLVDKLISEIRKNKKSVGVIAIDPSSSKSGGALLGDRTRFLLDPNNYYILYL